MEKPLARNAEETREIVDAFKAKGVPLFSAYYRRGQTKFRKAREIVASGKLGTITSLTYRLLRPRFRTTRDQNLPWRFKAPVSGGGLIMDVGVHTLDIIDFIVGPLRQACGHATNAAGAYAVEDSVTIAATFGPSPAPAIASLSWSFAAAEGTSDDTICIQGTKGTMQLSTFVKNDEIILHLIKSDEEGKDGEAEGDWINARQQIQKDIVKISTESPEHAHQPLVQLIVDELRGGAESPSKGGNALRCALVVDAALEGYYGGRSGAFWEREGSWPGQPSCRI